MSGTENRKELPLTSAGSGCSCGSTDEPTGAASTGDADYAVEGLTCGHCVATVEKAVTALDGVEAASVDLVPGGRSRLVVSGSAAEAAIRDAVTSAGYRVLAN